ncbi:hypothetical protein Hs30E_15740 [Lactococcus hodotermopsidis]|uniref:Phage protein n=1 Tax=Pseudolactococcus hodotermopsidis TaxID=2709157 RepID=A0A6A0BE96_9LACT|nr:hypothetical protein [Lactococcus hodotermopsidis]GFH43023.1 hypothetical protein Hs30E_15740 [Lactococcus hodotermopsidis]
MTKYRKKPVVIEAFQVGYERCLPDWLDEAITRNDVITHCSYETQPFDNVPKFDSADIKTLEGTMHAQKSDYIIKGVQGELYPCKPDIFEATYEVVE